MALDFPNSPILGQQFSAAGVAWTWDGAKWLSSGLSPTVVPGINDNRIINGDIRIDARNNGAGGTAIGYTVDRWQYAATQASKGTWGRSGSGLPVFPYALKFTSSSSYAVLTSDYFAFSQPIEADMVTDFQWGMASAQPATLSFWAFSSLAGTFGGVIGNNVGTRGYPFTYSLVGSTWTRIVVTIPGDTTGAWTLSGNGAAIYVYFGLGAGATYSAPAGAWVTGNYVGAAGAVSVVGTNAATFYVTGVKLEIGSVATPFNRQSLAKSMADCQRYYLQLQTTALATANGSGWYLSSSPNFLPMRAVPTVVQAVVGTDLNVNSPTIDSITVNNLRILALSAAAGQMNFTRILSCSAEL